MRGINGGGGVLTRRWWQRAQAWLLV
jgi:hypothetical protein